jgi:hypothetical protein
VAIEAFLQQPAWPAKAVKCPRGDFWPVDNFGSCRGVHTAEFVTPTGARYRSTAPSLPGPPVIAVSEIEVRIGIAITDLHAA